VSSVPSVIVSTPYLTIIANIQVELTEVFSRFCKISPAFFGSPIAIPKAATVAVTGEPKIMPRLLFFGAIAAIACALRNLQ
jgi:hypothetical protein